MISTEIENTILRAAEAILRDRAHALQAVAVPRLSADQADTDAFDGAYAAACGFAAADELAHFRTLAARLESDGPA